MSPTYSAVYQIVSDPEYQHFSNWILIFQSVIFLVGLFLFVFGLISALLKPPSRWRLPKIASVVLLTLGLFVIWIIGIPAVRSDSTKALAAYQEGDYQTVEGSVTDFDPMPFGGHKEECFSVQSKRFCYSDYEINPGFRNSASHGGPIRSGLQVRIAYKPLERRNMILRLEIALPQSSVLH